MIRSRLVVSALLCATAPLVGAQSVSRPLTAPAAAPGIQETAPAQVLAQGKITSPSGSDFGGDMVLIGDHDENGVRDLVVGVPADDDEGLDRGAIWTLFLESDGTIGSTQKISDIQGNFIGLMFNSALDDQDAFGSSVAYLGDLNGDGTDDIAVGAEGDDDGGSNKGAVYILFLEDDARIKSYQKISARQGGLTDDLTPFDRFGASVDVLGDLDGDGVVDLVVGAPGHLLNFGRVYVLLMNTDGTVKDQTTIERADLPLPTPIPGTGFGESVAALGDLNGDCVPDLAVGSPLGIRPGGIHVLFLNPNASVKASVAIGADGGEGGLNGLLDNMDQFGASLTVLGDANADGAVDLAVGAPGDDDGATDSGAVWTLFLDRDGNVSSMQKLSALAGGVTGGPSEGDGFGSSVAALGTFDGDDLLDLAVGAAGDDSAGSDLGAVYELFLDGTALTASATPHNGSSSNPSCLSSAVVPAIGTTFTMDVDHSGHPGAVLTVVVVRARAISGLATRYGEVLVDLTSCKYVQTTVVSAGLADTHSIPIPNDASLIGFVAEAQAVILGGAGPELCNALSLRIGP